MSSCKYYKQKKQVSWDFGQTWSDVSPAQYQVGGLYEIDSIDCQDELITRWVEIPDGFLCENKNKYAIELGEYSVDGGITFNSFSPPMYQLGRLLESNSEICNNKWEGYYEYNTVCPNGYAWIDGRGCVQIQHSQAHIPRRYDPVKYIRCSSSTSTTLTRDDVTYSPYDLYKGFIGECVTEISSETFASASSLVSISIPDTVNTIGSSAFYGCGLTSVTIPDSVTSIGAGAFLNCRNLSSATISNGLTSLPNRLFEGCYNLVNVRIPSGTTSIGDTAFGACSRLTEVTLPSSVTYIGHSAFGSTSLTNLTVLATTPPDLWGDTSFGNTPISRGNGVIYVPCESVYAYKLAAWWSNYADIIQGIPPCETPPTPYKIIASYSDGTTYEKECTTSSVITSGDPRPAGYVTSAMSSVTFGVCVTEIADNAFKNNYGAFAGLKSVTFPSTLNDIGYQAFLDCSGLTSVTIPAGVRTISSYAFYNCSGLTSITVLATTPPDNLGTEIFKHTGGCPIYVPQGSVDLYKTTGHWAEYASRIQPIPT